MLVSWHLSRLGLFNYVSGPLVSWILSSDQFLIISFISFSENKPAEPWHPVQITFDLPSDAAKRLSQLAESDDQALLRELGIISLQVQGEKVNIVYLLIKLLFKCNYNSKYYSSFILVNIVHYWGLYNLSLSSKTFLFWNIKSKNLVKAWLFR